MAENTNVTSNNTDVVQAEEKEAAGVPAEVFATKEDANKAWQAPTEGKGKKYKVFDILSDDKVIGHVWARGYDNALAKHARAVGFTSSYSNGGHASKPVTVDAALAFLASLTLEQRQAMGVVIAGDPPLPVADKGKGKGKGK